MKVTTPEQYMIDLEWDMDTLKYAKKFLYEWDTREDSFYDTHKKIHRDFDESEREHYRNCVNFWEEMLKIDKYLNNE